MTSAANERIGPGLSDFDGFSGTKPYAKPDRQDLSSALRKDAPETFLCPFCKRVILTEPVHLHTPASRQAVEGMRVCPACGGPFRPSRADNIYCSDSCQRKGSRRGRETITGRMENDRLMRRCEAPGCDRSLIGLTARAKYCSTKHRVKAAYHRRVLSV